MNYIHVWLMFQYAMLRMTQKKNMRSLDFVLNRVS